MLDKKIMYELDLDARIPVTTLSKKIRASKETVSFRIKRLLKENYLKGFYTVFNTSKLGMYYYKIYLKFHEATPEIEKRIIKFIKDYKTSAYVGSTEGNYDLISLILVKSARDFTSFLDLLGDKFGKYILEKDIHIVTISHRLNEKFLYAGSSSKHSYYQDKLENIKIDEIDKQLLQIISNNARISLVDLARKMKVDAKVAQYRLKKLEKKGIIIAYVSSPNFDKLSLRFIQLNFNLKNRKIIPEIIDFFDKTKTCLFALELIGKYDLTVEIHIKDEEELRKVLDKFKEQFVNQYNKYDILNIYKEHEIIWLPPY